MADTSVPITPGAGVNVDGFTQANGDVRQAVVVGDAAAANTQSVDTSGRASVLSQIAGSNAGAALGITASVSAYGYLRTVNEPGALFGDPFDTAIDTVDRWTVGGTVLPSLVAGRASVAPASVTASASSSLTTKAAFARQGLNFLSVGWVATLEAINATAGTTFYTGAHRFMGIGTQPTTWTATYSGASQNGPLQDAIGFEIDTDGLMYPCVYASGVRVRPAPLSGANFNVGRTLADGLTHSYVIVFRGDSVFWYIDGQTVPVAIYSYTTAGFALPDVETLPVRFHTLNGAAATSGVAVLRVGAIGVGDTGNTGSQIIDGKSPWRKATVDANGALSVNIVESSGTIAPISQVISAAIASAAGTVSGTGQVIVAVGSAGNVTITANTTAFAGTLVFEASDDGGTTWYAVTATREDGTGADNTIALSGATARMWTTAAPGFTHFRVRCSAFTSGTVTARLTPGPFLIETNPSLAGSTAIIGTVRQATDNANRTLFTAQVLAGALSTTETLVTLAPYRAGAVGTGSQSLTVTAGRTLRLQSMSVSLYGSATATATAITARLRYANGATTAVTSPIVDQVSIYQAATASQRQSVELVFGPDGVEFPAGYQFGVSVLGLAASGTYDVVLKGYEYV